MRARYAHRSEPQLADRSAAIADGRVSRRPYGRKVPKAEVDRATAIGWEATFAAGQ